MSIIGVHNMNMFDFFINKLKNIIRIGYISLNNSDDSKDRHIYTVSQYNSQFNSYAIYPYGISANAPENSQAVIFNIQDSQGVTACIPVNHKERFKNLNTGEVKIGNFVKKNNIFFDKDGNVIITSTNKKDAKIELDSDNIKFTFDNTTITLESDSINLNLGNKSILLDSSNIELNYDGATLTLNSSQLTSSVPIIAPNITLNGVDFNSHIHGGVQSGGSTTSTPQ